MGIERARVVEVHAPSSATGRTGSGYLISDRLVLTSGRVAGRHGSIDVRPAEMGTWLDASLVWSADDGDAALVEVDDASALTMSPEPMRWGALAGGRPVAVTATGFPPSAGRPEWFRSPIQFVGQLGRAGGSFRSVTVPPGGQVPGDGMCGAALFAGAELVGVLLVDGATEHLRAVPVSTLAEDAAFAQLVADGQALPLTPVSAPSFGFPILPATGR